MIVLTLLLAAGLQGTGDALPLPGRLEGRPAPADLSPLQTRIDEARPGDRITVDGGVHDGDLFIDKPVILTGRNRPLLRGSGHGSVVRVRAAGVVIEGFDVDGRGGGELGKDTSGIHIAAPGVTVRDCRIQDSLFGIYLMGADDAVVEANVIHGMPGRDPGEVGSGIHLWNSHRFRLAGNTIAHARDGFYIQSSTQGRVSGNRASDLRYGLHYMFSDDNVFEDNVFERGAAGAALMYSNRLVFRRNRFVRNRGFASVGLLLKACDDVIAEGNLIADNARGLFLEGSYRNRFLRNVIAMSDTALVVYDSSGGNRFEGNSFIGNLTPLTLSGRRTDTHFEGNYWSDHRDPDLDGDGVADRPYRLSSVFDHLRSNLTAADLFALSAAAAALGAAERTFPVLDAVPVLDLHPLAHPPRLAAIPSSPGDAAMPGARVWIAPSLLAFGVSVLAVGRRQATASGVDP
jgi:nitrous oxidase accessory protein